jgi:hypothetical protein
MESSYRDRIRAAIVDVATDIAAVQEQVTNAADAYERAKKQGKLAELRPELEAQRSLVLIAKAALAQRVEQIKDLAAQMPADSDDGGLFDTLAVSLQAVEAADEFIENTGDDIDND